MTDVPFTPEHIINSSFDLLAAKGWGLFNLPRLASYLGCPLKTLYGFYPSKTALLTAMLEHINQATLNCFAANTADIDNLSESERLFEVIMACFEASLPYKPAFNKVIQDFKARPTLFLEHVPLALRSLKGLLEIANIPTSGLLAPLQVRAFALLYLKLTLTWLEDPSTDLAKTMAAVDRMTTHYFPYIFHPEQLLKCPTF